MSFELFELPQDVARVWDLQVPIIHDETGKNIKMYITGEIEEPAHYNEMCYFLETAQKDTVIDIYLNTPGGIVDSSFMIASYIAESKAKVIGHLNGTVGSSGTIISMVCSELKISPYLLFMIHNYSGGMSGKGHEMKARQQFIDNHLAEVFKSFYAGFLTPTEIRKVLDGIDFWMDAKEVKKRWKNRQKFLKGKA